MQTCVVLYNSIFISLTITLYSYKLAIHHFLPPLLYCINTPTTTCISCNGIMAYCCMQDATSGRTALHYAVELENFMLVNFLMESGVDANATTFAGEQYTLWLLCHKDIHAKLYELLHCVLYMYPQVTLHCMQPQGVR